MASGRDAFGNLLPVTGEQDSHVCAYGHSVVFGHKCHARAAQWFRNDGGGCVAPAPVSGYCAAHAEEMLDRLLPADRAAREAQEVSEPQRAVVPLRMP